MKIGCFQSCACITSCCEFAKKCFIATIITLEEVRKNPDAFQKACIVFRSTIKGMNYICKTNYIPELIRFLDVAETLDFYGFCRLPSYFLHVFSADRIDEFAVLDQLELILCEKWQKGNGLNRDPLVLQFAKEKLTLFLQKMLESNLTLKSQGEVKHLLQEFLVSDLLKRSHDNFDPSKINLSTLSIPLKKPPWIIVIIDWLFITIDIICLPAFFRDWSLIDLSFYSRQLGQIRFLAWIPNQKLDDWIWRALFLGYFLQSAYAGCELCKGRLFAEKSKEIKITLIAALAECLYILSILKQLDPRVVTLLAFCSKSLGLVRIFYGTTTTFFAKP